MIGLSCDCKETGKVRVHRQHQNHHFKVNLIRQVAKEMRSMIRRVKQIIVPPFENCFYSNTENKTNFKTITHFTEEVELFSEGTHITLIDLLNVL